MMKKFIFAVTAIIIAIICSVTLIEKPAINRSSDKYIDISQFKGQMTDEEYKGLKQYRSVLEDDEPFDVISFLRYEKKKIHISLSECTGYIDTVYPVDPEYQAEIKGIASCDLNHDGSNELVIAIENNDGEYLILENDNGVISGALEVFRGFSPIYTSGIYGTSGGAADNDFLQYVSTDLDKSKLICRMRTSESNPNVPVYYIGGKKVDEDEFYKYIKPINESEELKFYPVPAKASDNDNYIVEKSADLFEAMNSNPIDAKYEIDYQTETGQVTFKDKTENTDEQPSDYEDIIGLGTFCIEYSEEFKDDSDPDELYYMDSDQLKGIIADKSKSIEKKFGHNFVSHADKYVSYIENLSEVESSVSKDDALAEKIKENRLRLYAVELLNLKYMSEQSY